jgi:hypothetical protein
LLKQGAQDLDQHLRRTLGQSGETDHLAHDLNARDESQQEGGALGRMVATQCARQQAMLARDDELRVGERERFRFPDGGRVRSPRRSAEFLGESDEKPLRPADVAEPIGVSIPDHFAYELRTAIAEPLKRAVDVVHGEHDAQVA